MNKKLGEAGSSDHREARIPSRGARLLVDLGLAATVLLCFTASVMVFGIPGTGLSGGIVGVIARQQHDWLLWGGMRPVAALLLSSWMLLAAYLVLPRALGRQSPGSKLLAWVGQRPTGAAISGRRSLRLLAAIMLLLPLAYWIRVTLVGGAGVIHAAAGYERARNIVAGLPDGRIAWPDIPDDARGESHRDWSHAAREVGPGAAYAMFTVEDESGRQRFWQLHHYRNPDLIDGILEQLGRSQARALAGLGDRAVRLDSDQAARILVVDGESLLIGEAEPGQGDALEAEASQLLTQLPRARASTRLAFAAGSWIQSRQRAQWQD